MFRKNIHNESHLHQRMQKNISRKYIYQHSSLKKVSIMIKETILKLQSFDVQQLSYAQASKLDFWKNKKHNGNAKLVSDVFFKSQPKDEN